MTLIGWCHTEMRDVKQQPEGVQRFASEYDGFDPVGFIYYFIAPCIQTKKTKQWGAPSRKIETNLGLKKI